jgi:hypothetical protein
MATPFKLTHQKAQLTGRRFLADYNQYKQVGSDVLTPKGEGVSPTEALVSTTMGPIGAAATEAQAVKAIIEQGGKVAAAVNGVIGAVTNVASDAGAKVLKGDEVTSGDVASKGLAGAATAMLPAKPALIQPIAGEAINTAADALKNVIDNAITGGQK